MPSLKNEHSEISCDINTFIIFIPGDLAGDENEYLQILVTNSTFLDVVIILNVTTPDNMAQNVTFDMTNNTRENTSDAVTFDTTESPPLQTTLATADPTTSTPDNLTMHYTYTVGYL